MSVKYKRKERRTIYKRIILAKIHSLQFYMCRVFPINSKRIVVCSYEGRGGFGCNPKYIIELVHEKRPDLEIIWLVNDTGKRFPEYIKIIPNTNWNRAYWLSTAKVWIGNYRTKFGTKKRKGQFYLNTWHGMVGFKTIGLWRKEGFSNIARIVSEADSKLVDCFLSDSAFTDEYYPKGLLYDGNFLKSGSPRCDILINEVHNKKRMQEKYGLDDKKKYVMYAPTFRENSKNGVRTVDCEKSSIDFSQMIRALEEKFGGEWVVCLRMHPQVKTKIDYSNQYIDFSDEDDMYECMVMMDALVTDYSSCAMDAELMHIPIFIYAEDIDDYKCSRGGYVWELDGKSRDGICINKEIFPEMDVKLPFKISHSNKELTEDILNFDQNEYIKRLVEYEKEIGIVRNGKASEVVVKRILEEMD